MRDEARLRRTLRPIRWLIGGLTILSWALLALALTGWVRSAWVADRWGYQTAPVNNSVLISRDTYVAISAGGGFTAARFTTIRQFTADDWAAASRMLKPTWFHVRTDNQGDESLLGGFAWASGNFNDSPYLKHTSATVPYWFLVLLALPLTVRSGFRFRRSLVQRKRLAAGHCPTCGYDLRATPQRCPECGAAAPRAETGEQETGDGTQGRRMKAEG